MATMRLLSENSPPRCPITSRKPWMSRISSSHEIDPETIDAVIELGGDYVVRSRCLRFALPEGATRRQARYAEQQCQAFVCFSPFLAIQCPVARSRVELERGFART